MKKFMAYLMDSDTVAFGLGDVEFGDTKEEAIQKLKDAWEAGFVDDSFDAESAWQDSVENGELRLFVKEVSL